MAISPVSALVNAEASLVNAVAATTAQVKQVATSALPAALADLHNAVEEAKGRIQSAAMLYRATLNDLGFDLASLTADILADLESISQPATPVFLPLPVAPVVEEFAEVTGGSDTVATLMAEVEKEGDVTVSMAANSPVEEPVAAPLVPLQGMEVGETESTPASPSRKAQKGKGKPAKAKVAKAYWLKGTPYCLGCVECDTPCMSEGERKCSERAAGAGNCGCCGKSF